MKIKKPLTHIVSTVAISAAIMLGAASPAHATEYTPVKYCTGTARVIISITGTAGGNGTYVVARAEGGSLIGSRFVEPGSALWWNTGYQAAKFEISGLPYTKSIFCG